MISGRPGILKSWNIQYTEVKNGVAGRVMGQSRLSENMGLDSGVKPSKLNSFAYIVNVSFILARS